MRIPQTCETWPLQIIYHISYYRRGDRLAYFQSFNFIEVGGRVWHAGRRPKHKQRQDGRSPGEHEVFPIATPAS
jgi:hypothetical protein